MNDSIALLLLALSLAALWYIYAGYPLLLALLVRIRGPRRIRRRAIEPSVSLLISAYNEEAVIRRKIDNALALDYPRHLLDIVIVSDASSDATDAIVSEYADGRVTLVRQAERRGKTAGLNAAVPQLRGDIVVFSDANAMYEPDAIRKLVRNFADPQVGCVTGEARYRVGSRAAADRGERVYWNYEMRIKRLETAVGSMVGGDGAIYAIRKALWRELPSNAINDFLNPLQIVAAGWRGVYEPAAVCHEETAGRTGVEYARRIRIVSRSWRAVFQAKGVLNPFRVGLFAWALVSHKMLRWFSGLFAGVAASGLVWLFVHLALRWPVAAAAWMIGAVLLAGATRRGRRETAMLAYFAAINAASLVGVAKGVLGRVSGVWTTPRETSVAPLHQVALLVPAGRIFLLASAIATIGAVALLIVEPAPRVTAILFWTSAGVLAYVYAGYPLVLAVWRRLRPRPVAAGVIEPSVCILVAAYNEAQVIEAKLRNTLALDYPAYRLDIVVASDGSEDATTAIVRRFAPRVRLLEAPKRRGKMAAIHAGMRTIDSEIVVFSDANTFLAHDAIRALVRNFADPEVGSVSGDVALTGDRAALGPSEDLYYKYERRVQEAESAVGSTIGADGALYAIRRELFVPPPADTILDDMAIPMGVIRANRRVVYEPSARGWEHGVSTAKEEFARKSRVLAGALQFMQRTDSAVPLTSLQVLFSLLSHKALRWLSPVFATCALLTSANLAAASPTYATAAGLQALILAFGLAGCVPRLRRSAFIAIPHYFCLVQAAAAVGILRGMSGRQSVLWRRFERHGPTADPALNA